VLYKWDIVVCVCVCVQLCACKVGAGLSTTGSEFIFKNVNNFEQCVVLLKVVKVLLNLGNTGSSCFTFSISRGCCVAKCFFYVVFVTIVCDWLVEAEPFVIRCINS